MVDGVKQWMNERIGSGEIEGKKSRLSKEKKRENVKQREREREREGKDTMYNRKELQHMSTWLCACVRLWETELNIYIYIERERERKRENVIKQWREGNVLKKEKEETKTRFISHSARWMRFGV